MIRVGRCTYNENGKRIDPEIKGFTNIVVLMKSSPYWELSPYYLKDENGVIMENKWQFSKVYPKVPATTQKYSRYDNTVVWKWKEETHIDNYSDSEKKFPNSKYLKWRNAGMKNKFAVRYPVGFKNKSNCAYALKTATETEFSDKLGYIDARKQIYIPEYCRLVKRQKKFKQLKRKIAAGENIMIVEVDGPHGESISHYIAKYGVKRDFILNNSMLVEENNIKIMLNDPKHNFGHGYCLAMALLGKEEEWLVGEPKIKKRVQRDDILKTRAIIDSVNKKKYDMLTNTFKNKNKKENIKKIKRENNDKDDGDEDDKIVVVPKKVKKIKRIKKQKE